MVILCVRETGIFLQRDITVQIGRGGRKADLETLDVAPPEASGVGGSGAKAYDKQALGIAVKPCSHIM